MRFVANPYKLSGSIKDYLVAHGTDLDSEYKLKVRIFLTTRTHGTQEKAREYCDRHSIETKYGSMGEELARAFSSFWFERRKLVKLLPASHLPRSAGWGQWLDASLALDQIANLSLEDWVQEVRLLAIPAELVRLSIPIISRGAIAKLSI